MKRALSKMWQSAGNEHYSGWKGIPTDSSHFGEQGIGTADTRPEQKGPEEDVEELPEEGEQVGGTQSVGGGCEAVDDADKWVRREGEGRPTWSGRWPRRR